MGGWKGVWHVWMAQLARVADACLAGALRSSIARQGGLPSHPPSPKALNLHPRTPQGTWGHNLLGERRGSGGLASQASPQFSPHHCPPCHLPSTALQTFYVRATRFPEKWRGQEKLASDGGGKALLSWALEEKSSSRQERKISSNRNQTQKAVSQPCTSHFPDGHTLPPSESGPMAGLARHSHPHLAQTGQVRKPD